MNKLMTLRRKRKPQQTNLEKYKQKIDECIKKKVKKPIYVTNQKQE